VEESVAEEGLFDVDFGVLEGDDEGAVERSGLGRKCVSKVR
jgi:hypothetical protein